MSQGDLLARIIRRLEDAAIPSMVVGSLASSFHGEPRTTRDIDIVIDPTAEALRQLVDDLPDTDFYADADAAAEAFERRTSFNVIEIESGWKVDLLVRRDRPFSRAEFDRRISVRLFDVDTHVATAEDMIIAKLEWAQAGESQRQLRDVAAMLSVNAQTLDRAYMDRWVADLDLKAAWDQAQAHTTL